LQGNVLGHEWIQCTNGISNPFMEQGDRGGGENTLRRGKPDGENGETGSWGVEYTHELQNSLEEPRNRHQGVLEPLHGMFLSLGKNGDEGV
jgi:hypothetical protein